MKRVLLSLGATIVLVSAIAWAKSHDSATNHNQLMGTWQLVSGEYSGQPAQPGPIQVKVLSDKRFMWVRYDPTKNKTQATGYGTYTLNGDTYTERPDLLDVGDPAADASIGKDLTFTVKVDGNTMTQTGTVGTMKLKETWKRLE